MTYLYFFSRSSLGIQLILSTTLNQKQTLAQGTSIPEDKEGTNTLHQRRKPLGQIFRDSFLQALLPCKKQGAERGMHLSSEIPGDPHGDTPTQRRESKGVQTRSTTHIPPKQDRRGAFIPRSDIYCFPTMFALTGSSG